MEGFKDLTDEAVVKRVQDGERDFYREIVDRYQNKLLRYAKYLTREDSAAADVVQETLIKAYVNLFGFDIKKKFSSWIYRIAHNEAINHIKKYHREVELSGKIDWADPTPSQSLDMEEEFLKRQLRGVLNKLPLTYREPLILFYLEGYSYEEISDILRIPLGTVGTQIHRGKKILATLVIKDERLRDYV